MDTRHPSQAVRVLFVGTLVGVAGLVLAADRGTIVEVYHRGRGIPDELHQRLFKAADAGAGRLVSLHD